MLPASLVDRHMRRAPRASVVCVAVLLATVLLSACSLDWSVRADAADAATVDASATDSPGPDAPTDAASADSPPSSDSPAADCTALATDVANARKKARECQLGTAGQCTTTVDDECGCKVVITAAGSASATAYTSAVAALVSACGKPAACATTSCPQIGLPASWACLSPDGTVHCTP